MRTRKPVFYDPAYQDVPSLVRGLAAKKLLVHTRVSDGKDLTWIEPSAGAFLRSTEAWQTAIEIYGRGVELTFFADDLAWTTATHVLKSVDGKSGPLDAVFVERADDIVQCVSSMDDKVRLSNGQVVPWYRSPLYDHDDPVLRSIPPGVETGDWFTLEPQKVVAIVPAKLLEKKTLSARLDSIIEASMQLRAMPPQRRDKKPDFP